MFIELVISFNYLIFCYFLFLLFLIFSSIRVFSNESVLRISGQSIGVSALVLPMNIQDWFALGLTGLISLQSKRLSRVFSNITVQKRQFLGAQFSLWSNSHIHTWLKEKSYLWLDKPLLAKWCLWFLLMLYRFVLAFLLRSKCVLIYIQKHASKLGSLSSKSIWQELNIFIVIICWPLCK